MSFADLPLAAVDGAAIDGLIAIAAPEGLRLEFKRELDLTSKEQKREAGKDASAMANTTGGRIIYGLEEAELPDGSKVAKRIVPLSDGSAVDKLADVLAAVVTPRPHFNIHAVHVSGGVVLVLEVYASPLDLHMVSGYDDFRYYRRGPKGTIKMTEPEIREAYARISGTKRGLDHDVEAAIASEASQRTTESIFVVPWHAAPNLADPRLMGSIGVDLAKLFSAIELNLTSHVGGLRLGPDGYRNAAGSLYLAVLRNGVVHFGRRDAMWRPPGTEFFNFPSKPALARIVEALLISQHVLARAHYWGRVRVLYYLRAPGPFTLDGWHPYYSDTLIETGAQPFKGVPVDANFQELGDRFGTVAKEILDQVFQLSGVTECPYLDRDGCFTERDKPQPHLPEQLLRFLG